MNKIKESAKAFLGGVLAGLITLVAVAANAKGIADVTFVQWILVGISAIGTWVGVYSIPNKPKIGVPPISNEIGSTGVTPS